MLNPKIACEVCEGYNVLKEGVDFSLLLKIEFSYSFPVFYPKIKDQLYPVDYVLADIHS